MFKVGQLAVNIDEGTTHQIRHIKIQNGEQMLGFGRKRFAWCFAKYYRKYKKGGVMDIQKDKDFTSLPEIAKLYQACKERDLTIAEREYLKGARDAWQAAKAQAVPEWISVEDGLPSDGQNIIAFDAIKHCVFKDGEFLQGYFEPDTGHEYTEPVDVTHWIAIEPQEPTND